MSSTKKILVAPLNWGLGHATRCIPIINELIHQSATVYLASDGRASELLKKEFPDLPLFQLPPYRITYGSRNSIFNIIKQSPKILNAVFKENKLLKKIISDNKINGVVSDNRLGCFSKKVPSVFITHQINLILPSIFFQWWARQINYSFIKKYKECWVPDVNTDLNICGALSHGTPIQSLKYIGALSRMEKYKVNKKNDVIVVLSGPEPQRSILEKKIIGQAQKTTYSFLIVQGKTEKIGSHFNLNKNIKIVPYLTSEELNNEILAADIYIGRTGYSTLMDLAKLDKHALLIPTPGQTEQEYLGHRLDSQNIFQIKLQDDLNLVEDIRIALKKGRLNNSFFDNENLKSTIKNFLSICG